MFNMELSISNWLVNWFLCCKLFHWLGGHHFCSLELSLSLSLYEYQDLIFHRVQWSLLSSAFYQLELDLCVREITYLYQVPQNLKAPMGIHICVALILHYLEMIGGRFWQSPNSTVHCVVQSCQVPWFLQGFACSYTSLCTNVITLVYAYIFIGDASQKIDTTLELLD